MNSEQPDQLHREQNQNDASEEVAVDSACGQPTPDCGNPINSASVEQVFDRWTGAKGIYRPAAATLDKLPAGIYSAEQDNRGLYLEAKRFPSDYLLDLPGLPTRLILDEVQKLWEREDIFRKFGFLHKRGILMCGPAGCGKTSIIRMVCNDIIARDGIVLIVQNASITILALQAIREVEPRRTLLTITEDLDTFFRPGKDYSKQMLSMYDGENQVNHVVHLATTNHPEELEDRVIQRPSRFDMVLCLGTPNADARRAYLRHILGQDFPEGELETIVRGTKGLSLAHLKEYLVATLCFDKTPEETLARLQANMKKKPTLGTKGGIVGFGGEGFRFQYFGNEATEERLDNPS